LLIAGPRAELPAKFGLIKGKNVDELLALLQDVGEGVPAA
jgi:hypothetical protein